MTQARDFLERFRPAGAPGAAGQAGVPADVAREQAAELDPVLALLDADAAECAAILDRAGREAERVAAQAREQVAAIGADAARRAGAARDEAAAQVLGQARARARAPVAEAEREAARIRERARERMPALVERAVALVRSGAAAGPPP